MAHVTQHSPKTRAQRMKASGGHGPSIKNPAVYEALVKAGASKSKAAAISNGALDKGYRKGRHRG